MRDPRWRIEHAQLLESFRAFQRCDRQGRYLQQERPALGDLAERERQIRNEVHR